MDRLSPLASPSATRAVLEAHGLSTKYSLGQNFLVNDAILQKIVALAEVGPDDVVLEVGPGIGTLTIALLKHAARVVAVERDSDLPAVLAETLAPWAGCFSLIQKDALDLTEGDLRLAPRGILRLRPPASAQDDKTDALCHPERSAPQLPPCHPERSAQQLPPCHPERSAQRGVEGSRAVPTVALPGKLVANLPYAVAATVVLDYFERFPSLESATVMVQKEVADRMAARPGTKSYGAYTVKLRLFAEPAGRFAVGPGNFFPPPRVESAVLRLNRRPVCDEAGEPLDAAALKTASVMADAAFANRRKTIANSCKTYFAGCGAPGTRALEALPQLFEHAGIDPRRRGETLDLQEFVALGRAYQQFAR